jgi:hypothetical protein
MAACHTSIDDPFQEAISVAGERLQRRPQAAGRGRRSPPPEASATNVLILSGRHCKELNGNSNCARIESGGKEFSITGDPHPFTPFSGGAFSRRLCFRIQFFLETRIPKSMTSDMLRKSGKDSILR